MKKILDFGFNYNGNPTQLVTAIDRFIAQINRPGVYDAIFKLQWCDINSLAAPTADTPTGENWQQTLGLLEINKSLMLDIISDYQRNFPEFKVGFSYFSVTDIQTFKRMLPLSGVNVSMVKAPSTHIHQPEFIRELIDLGVLLDVDIVISIGGGFDNKEELESAVHKTIDYFRAVHAR